jgi:hypothetical protein
VHIVSGVGGLLLARATHAFAWHGSETPQSASVVHASSLFRGAGSLQASRGAGFALSLVADVLASAERGAALDSGSGSGGATVTSAIVGAAVPALQADAKAALTKSTRRRFIGPTCRRFWST